MTELYSLDQVSEYLHVCKATLLNYCKNGRLRYRKIGRRYLISKDEVQRFIGPELCKKPPQCPVKPSFSETQLQIARERFSNLSKKS
jgi:excisionase family DNA binding protein